MKNFLILGAIFFSASTFAQTCAESKKEMEAYTFGTGTEVPDYNSDCFKNDKSYVKVSLEIFAKNIDATLNTIQLLERVAKDEKIQFLKQINELKANVSKARLSGAYTEQKKNEFRYAIAVLGQDIAIKSRMVGNELVNASAVGTLLGHFLPYLEENDNEFILRTLGYNNVKEVSELRDLLVDFRSALEKNYLEYDRAVKQYNQAGEELSKVIDLIEA